MMHRILFSLLLTCTVALSSLTGVHAAETANIRFDGVPASLKPGASIEVRVIIDAPVAVNTVAVDVAYPQNLFQVSAAHFERSIIDIRQQDPDVSTPGVVKIVGGSTQAFVGERGLLATIRFTARVGVAGEGVLSIPRAEVYASDGKGTPLSVRIESVPVVVSETGSSGAQVAADVQNPNIQSARIESSRTAFSGQLVTFQISDSSGVQSTHLRYRTGFGWSEWKPVVNPAAVPKTAWMVEVRATDYAGNTAVARAYAIPWSGLGAWGVIFFCLGAGVWYVRKRSMRRRSAV